MFRRRPSPAPLPALSASSSQPLFIRRHARGLGSDRGRAASPDRGARHHCPRERDRGGAASPSRCARAIGSRSAVWLDIAPTIIPPLVRGFERDHNDVDVRWFTGEHEQLMHRLEESTLDLAIVLDFEIAPTLQATILRPAPLHCVLARRSSSGWRQRVAEGSRRTSLLSSGYAAHARLYAVGVRRF